MTDILQPSSGAGGGLSVRPSSQPSMQRPPLNNLAFQILLSLESTQNDNSDYFLKLRAIMTIALATMMGTPYQDVKDIVTAKTTHELFGLFNPKGSIIGYDYYYDIPVAKTESDEDYIKRLSKFRSTMLADQGFRIFSRMFKTIDSGEMLDKIINLYCKLCILQSTGGYDTETYQLLRSEAVSLGGSVEAVNTIFAGMAEGSQALMMFDAYKKKYEKYVKQNPLYEEDRYYGGITTKKPLSFIEWIAGELKDEKNAIAKHQRFATLGSLFTLLGIFGFSSIHTAQASANSFMQASNSVDNGGIGMGSAYGDIDPLYFWWSDPPSLNNKELATDIRLLQSVLAHETIVSVFAQADSQIKKYFLNACYFHWHNLSGDAKTIVNHLTDIYLLTSPNDKDIRTLMHILVGKYDQRENLPAIDNLIKRGSQQKAGTVDVLDAAQTIYALSANLLRARENLFSYFHNKDQYQQVFKDIICFFTQRPSIDRQVHAAVENTVVQAYIDALRDYTTAMKSKLYLSSFDRTNQSRTLAAYLGSVCTTIDPKMNDLSQEEIATIHTLIAYVQAFDPRLINTLLTSEQKRTLAIFQSRYTDFCDPSLTTLFSLLIHDNLTDAIKNIPTIPLEQQGEVTLLPLDDDDLRKLGIVLPSDMPTTWSARHKTIAMQKYYSAREDYKRAEVGKKEVGKEVGKERVLVTGAATVGPGSVSIKKVTRTGNAYRIDEYETNPNGVQIKKADTRAYETLLSVMMNTFPGQAYESLLIDLEPILTLAKLYTQGQNPSESSQSNLESIKKQIQASINRLRPQAQALYEHVMVFKTLVHDEGFTTNPAIKALYDKISNMEALCKLILGTNFEQLYAQAIARGKYNDSIKDLLVSDGVDLVVAIGGGVITTVVTVKTGGVGGIMIIAASSAAGSIIALETYNFISKDLLCSVFLQYHAGRISKEQALTRLGLTVGQQALMTAAFLYAGKLIGSGLSSYIAKNPDSSFAHILKQYTSFGLSFDEVIKKASTNKYVSEMIVRELGQEITQESIEAACQKIDPALGMLATIAFCTRPDYVQLVSNNPNITTIYLSAVQTMVAASRYDHRLFETMITQEQKKYDQQSQEYKNLQTLRNVCVLEYQKKQNGQPHSSNDQQPVQSNLSSPGVIGAEQNVCSQQLHEEVVSAQDEQDKGVSSDQEASVGASKQSEMISNSVVTDAIASNILLQRYLGLVIVAGVGGDARIHEGGDQKKPVIATLIDVHFNGDSKKLPLYINYILSHIDKIDTLFPLLKQENRALYEKLIKALDQIQKDIINEESENSDASMIKKRYGELFMKTILNTYLPPYEQGEQKKPNDEPSNSLTYAEYVCAQKSLAYAKAITNLMEIGYKEQGLLAQETNNTPLGAIFVKVKNVVDALASHENKNNSQALRRVYGGLINRLMGTSKDIPFMDASNGTINDAIKDLLLFTNRMINEDNGVDAITVGLIKTGILNTMYSYMTLFSHANHDFFVTINKSYESIVNKRKAVTNPMPGIPAFLGANSNILQQMYDGGAITLQSGKKTPLSANNKGMEQPAYGININQMADLIRGRWLIDQNKAFGYLKKLRVTDQQAFFPFLIDDFNTFLQVNSIDPKTGKPAMQPADYITQEQLHDLFSLDTIEGEHNHEQRKLVYKLVSGMILYKFLLANPSYSLKNKGGLRGKPTATGYVDVKVIQEHIQKESSRLIGSELQCVAMHDNVNEANEANHIIKDTGKMLTALTRSLGYVREQDLYHIIKRTVDPLITKYQHDITRIQQELKDTNLTPYEKTAKEFELREKTMRMNISYTNDHISINMNLLNGSFGEEGIKNIIKILEATGDLNRGVQNGVRIYRTKGAAKAAKAIGKSTPGDNTDKK